MSDPVATDDSQEESQGSHAGGSLAKLVVGAVGVVFGDIGTSPIYAFRETFVGPGVEIAKRSGQWGMKVRHGEPRGQ